jgi:hypothetical protein
MSVDVGFPSVRECLDLHSQPPTDTDFIELEQSNSIPTVRKKEKGVSQRKF